MKYTFLLAILVTAATVQGQKLKDLLYSGKLKNDSGTVIRKTDDLSTKIDTSEKKKQAVALAAANNQPGNTEPAGTNAEVNPVTDQPAGTNNVVNAAGANNTPSNTGPKDNNTIWKEYMATVMEELKTEVIPDKRLKPGTYYILIEYAIETDGTISINNILPSPDSDYLKEQLKRRMTLSVPQMSPVMVSGKAKKSVKKYNFTLTK